MLNTDQPTPCDQNPQRWFDPDPEQIIRVKALCIVCPVKLACLEDALETEEQLGMQLKGVHGSLTEAERLKLSIKRIA